MFPPLAVADCNIITKAFERGANFSATEESVFAMMTPMLTGMRAQAKAFIKLAGASEAIIPDDDILVIDSDKTMDKPAPLSSHAIETLGETDTSVQGTAARKKPSAAQKLLNDCIPCEFRIEVAGDLFKKMWEDIKQQGLYYLEYFKSILQQLLDLLKFWDTDKYNINLCNLWKFFSEFVCIPDFRRIISLLMAVIVLMAIEINGLFDIILMLVAPLLLPFLMALIAPLEQMLLMIIKPIDCIINAIVVQMEKLDYSAIFNIQVPTIKLGPRGLKKDQSALKTSTFNNPTAQKVIDQAQSWGFEQNINPAQLFASHVGQEKEDLAEAEKWLDVMRQKGGNVDMQDAKAREEYQKELDQARAEVQAKRSEVDQTEIQQATAAVRKVQKDLRDALSWVMQWVTYAKTKVTEYVNMLFGEIKKIMESFLGSSGNTMLKLFDKLQICQLLAMIVAIIDFIGKKKSCKEEKDDVVAYPGSSQGSPLGSKNSKVWTDENGVTHIEEDPALLAAEMEAVVGSIGAGRVTNPTIVPKAKVIGDGSSPLDATRQRVQSLIELTGDATLDTTIARAVDAITKPIKLEFKCPLQTSVTDAEQVNKWIEELSSR